jgi:hypothetical protein
MIRDRMAVPWVSCIVSVNCLNNLEYSQKAARLVLLALGNIYSPDDLANYTTVNLFFNIRPYKTFCYCQISILLTVWKCYWVSHSST